MRKKKLYSFLPLDHASAIFLNKIQPIFKFHLQIIITNLYGIDYKFEKPIFLSTGLINNAELKKIYKFLK